MLPLYLLFFSFPSFFLSIHAKIIESEDPYAGCLVLLMPGEGIGAQLNQLGSVYKGAQHRQIVLTPVKSHHYPDDELNLCYWFTFPPPFNCEYYAKTRIEWERELGPHCNTSHYLPVGVEFDKNLYNERCIQGPLPYGSNTWYSWGFSHHSRNLLSVVKKIMKVTSRHISFHWRRGDQLIDPERCGKADKSVNCADVHTYLKFIASKIAKHVPAGEIYPVYIATNEVNTTILTLLNEAGYMTPLSLKQSFAVKGLPLTPSMIAVIDVMMMCTAFRDFHNPGTSGLYGIIETCRKQKLLK